MAWVDRRIINGMTDEEAKEFYEDRWKKLVSIVGEDNIPPRITVATDPSKDIGGASVSQIPTEQVVTETPPSSVHQANITTAGTSLTFTPPSPTKEEATTEPFPSYPDSQPTMKRPTPVSQPLKHIPGPSGIDYCPFGAVTKFCYKYIRREFSQAVATRFFDQGKIWEREWDLYYIYNEECTKPIVFVPIKQVQVLLDEINATYPKAKAAITDEEGFAISFEDEPQHLRPYFLGCSTSRQQHDDWVSQVGARPTSSLGMLPKRTLEAYKAKLAAAQEVQKQRSKAKKTAKLQRVMENRSEMSRKLLECERMLGLLPPKDQQSGTGTARIDLNKPVNNPFELDAVIIAFDVEAHERSSRAITEVGVAHLDTRDLKGVAPGINGENWHKFIHARHFRVTEYLYHINREFVQGCPMSFEFGKSEYSHTTGLPPLVGTCFRPPFCKKSENGAVASGEEEERNIILLGHDIWQDINYLATVGIDVQGRRGVMGKLDTIDMYKAYNNHPDSRALGSILAEFDLIGWHLHNAGNDAVYTMWAMLAIATAHVSGRETQAERVESLNAAKTEEALERTKERCVEDAQGWNTMETPAAPDQPKKEDEEGAGYDEDDARAALWDANMAENYAMDHGADVTYFSEHDSEFSEDEDLTDWDGSLTANGKPLLV